MSAGPAGDYGYVVEQLMQYLRGKGQIWSAAEIASLIAINEYVERRYGVSLPLRTLVENWVKLSELEASRWTTVAQRNVEVVTRLGAQINYVEEQGSRTRILPLGGRRKKE